MSQKNLFVAMKNNFNNHNVCPICGGEQFSYNKVLWSELIDAWELELHEIDYINRQQGFFCTGCGNNLRSMALADAILTLYCFEGTLSQFVQSKIFKSIKVLEINEAGGLTSFLSQLPGHIIIKYPEHDMTNLPFEQSAFDLILHSDTLEHVNEPIDGLSECKRVLNSTGACIFTVPIITGRLTRSRKGLKPSFHGSNKANEFDQIVCTEFGADVWQWPVLAGFKSATLHVLDFPSAIAVIAK